MLKKLFAHKQKLTFYIVLVIILGYLLNWHYRLILIRYFDIDEFAHLHWGYNLMAGEYPYRDFFYIFPPFFLYPVALIISVLGRSVNALISARVMIFLAFCGMGLTTFLITRKLRNTLTALIAVVVLSILPIPSDKMLEIRPDNIAIFLSLAGLYVFMLAHEKKSQFIFFLAGLFFSLSLGFVPKTIFFLIPPMMILIFDFITKSSVINFKELKDAGSLHFLPFISGISLPLLVIILLFIYYQKPILAIQSITSISAAITTLLGAKFYMRPDIFFYPNDTYYGLPGYSAPFLLNHLIYFSAALFAIFFMLSSLSHKDNGKCLREFMVGTSFFLNLYAFVYIFPLKHAQYLIPLTPFISIFFAILLEKITRHRLIHKYQMTLIVAVLVYFSFIARDMYKAKSRWTNQATISNINNILTAIPKEEKMFDLTGETVFFRDGYYFCCLPYGQYDEGIPFQLPNLEKSLRDNNVHLIHIGEESRLGILPAYHQSIINTYYIKDKLGMMTAGKKIDFEQGNIIKNFEIIAKGNYILYWNGAVRVDGSEAVVKLDDNDVRSENIYLSTGKHKIAASQKGELILKYQY
ncbi:hypothetical protein A3D03_03030 [Candidatus Gottesmanbacteria bacterium RIFCSPHIGHO2_02_FULL_40_13]|uniref:Glycosyltransferase RgtA/B/C/D-like domain-containing protein n=1 Tax=Candidatus Gottesmanbacteria bacterium RIFCSPHIGHO2_02_FULL_40_13 TaxID=1798384 RepID=A0A1F6ABH6_9BACT|nr:MAG: hypothetical protein A3D03_03030 [Candidatus Gottesmanbacteria bacterium RIFCSPHIGHO2_02_FULL_40_13]